MHKLFLGISSIIVTHFLQKAYRKITEKPTIDKEEIYRQMKKAEYDARPMRNDHIDALFSISRANLNLMERLR